MLNRLLVNTYSHAITCLLIFSNKRIKDYMINISLLNVKKMLISLNFYSYINAHFYIYKCCDFFKLINKFI